MARNDLCYCVESIDPVLRTAAMIIPVRHVATPFDLRADEWQSTHDLLREVREFLERADPSGYTIGWSSLPVAHAHLHVIARFADEPLRGQGLRYALKQESNRRLTPKRTNVLPLETEL